MKGRDRDDGVLHLRPPLYLAWRLSQGFPSEAPIATRALSFLVSGNHSCLALDTSTGVKQWDYRVPQKETGPLFLASGKVAVYVNPAYGKRGAQRIDFLDVKTGRRVRSVEQRARSHMKASGGLVVAGLADELECWSLPQGETLWHLDFGPDLAHWMLDQPFFANPDVTVFAVRGGRVRCIRTRTAELVWEASVSDVRFADQPGEVGGAMECFGRVLAVPLYQHTVGLSLDTGKRLWEIDRPPLPGRARCGDRLYMSWNRDGWGWLDPQEGKFHPSPRLEHPEGFLRYFGGDWLISSTHFFKAWWGWIDAWDRETGKLVWSAEAKGGKGPLPDAPLTVIDGRLYYRDSTYHTYCFEEVSPSDPVLKTERASGQSKPSPEALASGSMKIKAPPVVVIPKKSGPRSLQTQSNAQGPAATARNAGLKGKVPFRKVKRR